METNLKARILGAVVTVLALALILPNVLEKDRLSKELVSDIPPAPKTPHWVDEGQNSKVRIELESMVTGEYEKSLTAPEPRVIEQDDPKILHVAGERGSLDEHGAAVAWSLKVAAFKIEKNATAFRDQLRGKGFKAYILKSGDGQYSRVYVGPMIQRSKAEQVRTQLQKEMAIKGIRLQQYKPE